MQENKEVLKLAEKRKNPENMPSMSPEEIEKLVDLMVKQKLAQLTGQGGQLPQMMAQAAQMPPEGLIPQNAAQPGVPPEVMPTQMSMSPDDVVPDLPDLQQRQNRRAAYGRPPS